MEVKRLEFIDALKGFAIFLVIWGHVIMQLGAYPNFIYSIIYSFHMPLFFILSGFFFKSSLKLTLKDFLFKKSFQLLYPWFLWCLIVGVQQAFFHHMDNTNYLQKMILLFNRWFWFLRDLWLSYFFAYILYKIFKKGYLVAILGILFVICTPLLKIQSFYFPLFLFGILLKDNYSLIIKHLNKFLFISFFIFTACLFYFDDQHLSAFPNLFSHETYSYACPNIYHSLFRWIVGISGSVFFFTLFKKTYRENFFYSYLSKKGYYTLGIYIVQTIILEIILPIIPLQNVYKWNYVMAFTPIISLITLEICTSIIKFVSKNKKITKLLFGSSYS